MHRASQEQLPGQQRSFWSLALVALLVVACGMGAWLALRQPQLRQALVELVPHRYQIPTATTRQWLAPRSVLLASFAVALVLGSCALWPRTRAQLFAPLASRQRLLSAFVVLQSLLALAVVVNMHAYVWRSFGQPVWRVGEQPALEHSLPQVYPDSLQLKRMVPPQAHIALEPGGELVYMLASLSYPLKIYDGYPHEGKSWRDDPAFAEFARKKNIRYTLRYVPTRRARPLELEEIR